MVESRQGRCKEYTVRLYAQVNMNKYCVFSSNDVAVLLTENI